MIFTVFLVSRAKDLEIFPVICPFNSCPQTGEADQPLNMLNHQGTSAFFNISHQCSLLIKHCMMKQLYDISHDISHIYLLDDGTSPTFIYWYFSLGVSQQTGALCSLARILKQPWSATDLLIGVSINGSYPPSIAGWLISWKIHEHPNLKWMIWGGGYAPF